MTKLFASTAIAIALATPGFAQMNDHSNFMPEISAEARFASDLIGARLYASEAEVGDANEFNQDWEDVGEINDIVLGKDGQIKAVLIDIGGFLGIGEKQIAVSMDSLTFVSDGEDSNDYFIVVNSTSEALENAPEFEWTGENMASDASMNDTEVEAKAEEMANDTAEAANDAAEATEQAANDVAKETEQAANEVEEAADEAVAEADEAVETADADAEVTADANAEMNSEADAEMASDGVLGSEARDYRFTPPAIEREGWETAAADKLTTEDVSGAAVYDTKDEWIGEVNAIELDKSGKLGDAIIDVGGFLGIGEKRVAVNFQELTLQRGTDSGDIRIYVDATKEQLEELPEVED